MSRLLAIANGGQTLVSAAVAELVREAIPADVALLDLGEHRLRDLGRPMHVFQLAAAGVASDFPPLRSLSAHPNNLPLEITSFVGRTAEIREIVDRLGKHRIVTIVGTGGIGKTRTAAHVAAARLDNHADGVWFVDLAPISDGTRIPAAVAHALGIRLTDGDVADSLALELRHSNLLIVLDNCEHVIEAAADLASLLARTAPEVAVLATSRQALGIAGEATYALPPLPLPPPPHPASTPPAEMTGAVAERYPAIELFVARAKAANSQFVLSDADAPIVVEICVRLDGIALAIELAAARMRVLGATKLRELLEERFRVLRGGNRDALPRHQTMRATIDWSYDLLAPDERALLRRLAVFVGGWELEAAEAVCPDDVLRREDVFDLHASLAEKSLISADFGDAGTRYRSLESTRAYALEKLVETGERSGIFGRHARWVADFAEKAYESTWHASLAGWAPKVDIEIDNVRAALRWSLGEGADPALGAAIVGALVTFWYRRPVAALEGRDWLERALAAIDEKSDENVVARLYFTLALLTDGETSLESARRCVAIYERVGDAFHIAFSYRQLAVSLLALRRVDEALEAVDRAIATFERTGMTHFWPFAAALGVRASVLAALGRVPEARAYFERAIALFELIDDEQRAAFHRLNRSRMEFSSGNHRVALAGFDAALLVLRDSPYFGQEALARANAATAHIVLGEIDEAAREATLALRLAVRARAARAVVASIATIAAVAAMRGEADRAARLIRYCDAWYDGAGVERDAMERIAHESAHALSVTVSDTSSYSPLNEDQAIAEALESATD